MEYFSSAGIRRPDFSVFLCPEGNLPIFSVIQIPFSCRFLLAVDFLGLRRNGSSSQIINQGQYFLEQASWHGNLGQLESNIAAMADDLGSNLHQLFAQRGQRPVFHLLRQGQRPHEVTQIVGQGVKLEPDGVVARVSGRNAKFAT